MIHFRSYLLCFFLLFTFALDAQKTLSENAKISLLTCGSGDEAYSTFGHTAIRVKDANQDLDYAFHYGLFDFNDPNFYSKFLRGKLMYSMGAQRISSFKRQYTSQKRTVYEQELNLDQEQKEAVYNFLLENYKPENREYLYDFFFNNCSTIVTDRFGSVFSDIQFPSEVKEVTFRQMLDEHLTKMPWTDFGIDLIIGSIADREANQSEQFFLPIYVHDYFQNTFIDGKPLVKDETLMLDFIEERGNTVVSKFTPVNLFIGLLILELILLIAFFMLSQKLTNLTRVYDFLWYLILGIGGLILMFMWFGTDHDATKTNWNIVWMSPFYLLLILPKKWVKNEWKKWIIFLLLGLNLITVIGLLKPFQDIHSASYVIVVIMILKLFRNLKKKDHSKDYLAASA